MEANYVVSHAKFVDSADPGGSGSTYEAPASRNVFGWYREKQTISNPDTDDHVSARPTVVLVPDVSPYAPRDCVVLPGQTPEADRTFFVTEDIRDYTKGPFGFRPGGEIVLTTTRTFGAQTVILRSYANGVGRNRLNQPDRQPTDVEWRNVSMRPLRATESETLTDVATGVWRCVGEAIPAAVNAKATDEMIFNGDTYQITSVEPFAEMSGAVSHVRITCQRQEK